MKSICLLFQMSWLDEIFYIDKLKDNCWKIGACLFMLPTFIRDEIEDLLVS